MQLKYSLEEIAKEYGHVVMDSSAFFSYDGTSIITDPDKICGNLDVLLKTMRENPKFVVIGGVCEELARLSRNLHKALDTTRHYNGYGGGHKGLKERFDSTRGDASANLSLIKLKLDSVRSRSKRFCKVNVDEEFFSLFSDITDIAAEYVAENCNLKIIKDDSRVDQDVIASAHSLALERLIPIAIAQRDRGISYVTEAIRKMVSARNFSNELDISSIKTFLSLFPVVSFKKVSADYYFERCFLSQPGEWNTLKEPFFSRMKPFVSKLESFCREIYS